MFPWAALPPVQAGGLGWIVSKISSTGDPIFSPMSEPRSGSCRASSAFAALVECVGKLESFKLTSTFLFSLLFLSPLFLKGVK